MAWMAGYHALMRAALRIRIRTTRQRDVSSGRVRELAADASTHAGLLVDDAFVREILQPPEGRISSVVYARLEAAFTEPRAVIRAALFPRLRARQGAPRDPGGSGEERP
jgi:hypothetical protein